MILGKVLLQAVGDLLRVHQPRLQHLDKQRLRMASGGLTYLSSVIKIPLGEASLEAFRAQIFILWCSFDTVPP